MHPAVDLDRLRQFSDGTAEGLRTLVEIFVEDVAETIDALASAVVRRSADEMTLLAHRAGGSSAACGARDLAALLLTIEDLGRSGSIEQAEPLMAAVLTERARVTQFLTDYLDQAGEHR